jgi:hypothetical protein
MKQSLWVLNRLGATITGCIAVGVVANVIGAVADALTCAPTCDSIVGIGNVSHCAHYSPSCGDFVSSLIFPLALTIPIALVLGFLPGAAALLLTPARNHPWRSLPFLIVGTLIGFGIVEFLAFRYPGDYHPTIWAILAIVPSATGFLTALFINRIRGFRFGHGAANT